MAQVVADSGVLGAMQAWLNNARPANSLALPSANDMQIRFFTNNITPSANGSDTAATYTQATGGGYAPKTLSAGSWTCAVNAGLPESLYAIQTWAFSGVLTTNTTIYGYYIVDCSGTLVTAELVTPFTPSAAGTDTFSVTPKIAGSYGTPAA